MDTIINTPEYARSLIEASLDPLVTINADGKIMDVNGAMAKITDKEREKLIGTDFKDYFTDPEKAREVYQQVFAKGFVANYPLTIKDGVLTDVLFNGSVFKNKQGKVLGAVVVARDVTEKKRLQKAFEIERQQFYDLFSEAPFSLGVLSGPDHRFEMANPMYLQLIGKKDIIGKSVRDVLPEVEVQGFIEILDSVYQTGKTFTANEMIVKLDVNNTGKPVNKYLNYIYQPHIGSDGKPNGILFFAVDVTEQVMSRKKIEESEIALQQSEARLQGIIDSQTNYIIRTDLEGNYTYCNQKFRDDFGWLHGDDNVELLGINSMISIMPYHHQAVKHIVEKCFANLNKVFQIEIDKPAKNNGVKTTLWDFILLTDQEGRPEEIQCAGIDITDRKKAEVELEQLNEHLQKQTNELEISNAELEQFAYAASHDLQEPLRMVTSFLSQLENKYGNVIDDKGKQYINFAVDGAKRMRQIILDLLEFSKVGKTEDQLEHINLNDLINEVKLLLRKNIEEKSATISIDQLPEITSHRVPLLQVFQNLISNALKYSNKDIPVQIRITVKEFNDHWQFAVIDNGIGIENEYFEKIFILFQRLHNKDEYSGTGVGLAITKKIIGTLGGKIWVESEIGKGSSFYFTIKK